MLVILLITVLGRVLTMEIRRRGAMELKFSEFNYNLMFIRLNLSRWIQLNMCL